MAEEAQPSIPNTVEEENVSKAPSGFRKLLPVIFKSLRIGFYILLLVLFLVLCWQLANYVFSNTQFLDTQDNIESTGTVDVYEKEQKIQPLKTIDGGKYTFEIQTRAPNSLHAYVTIHVMLGYDPTQLPGYDPKTAQKTLLDEELSQRKMQIQDILRNILLQKTYEELHTSNSITLLKKELINNINHILVNGKITDIYVTEWNIIPTGY